MQKYLSKYGLLPGSSYKEVLSKARKEFDVIRKITKRQPYVRSKYFRGDKIFVTIFWDHVMQKHQKERRKRLKLYKSAIDLLRNSTEAPETFFDSNNKNIILHRFYGKTNDGYDFCVQVKVDKRSGRKDFMSVFERKT